MESREGREAVQGPSDGVPGRAGIRTQHLSARCHCLSPLSLLDPVVTGSDRRTLWASLSGPAGPESRFCRAPAAAWFCGWSSHIPCRSQFPICATGGCWQPGPTDTEQGGMNDQAGGTDHTGRERGAAGFQEGSRHSAFTPSSFRKYPS